ncbi:hypothetical protein AOA80_04005 [Methanomassiliicoccales archaeon RumEn M1]|nr:hypothetical protein AOA80_04005 [Methanomassiliicoccales archaeon RumEn M1]
MVLSGLMEFLIEISHDPILYSIVFFIYTVAATIVLPIPVEAGLFLSNTTPLALKALVLGLGKAAGASLVFKLGDKLESPLDRITSKWWLVRAFTDLMQRFVSKTRYLGLYLILSVPLMVDTVPIYIFAVFNKEGIMSMRYFVLTNFLAGITRAAIVYWVAFQFGIELTEPIPTP